MRRKIFIDMDGVLADFEKKANTMKLPPEQFKLMPGAYLYLDIIAGAKEAIAYLENKGFDLYVATKPPSDSITCASEKVAWIHEHFPSLKNKYIITFDKGLLGDEHDYLIDDRPHKANVKNFKGTFLFFGPNGVYKNWDQICYFFKDIESC